LFVGRPDLGGRVAGGAGDGEFQGVSAGHLAGPATAVVQADDVARRAAHAVLGREAFQGEPTGRHADGAGRAIQQQVVPRRAREVQIGHGSRTGREGQGSGRHGQDGLDTHLVSPSVCCRQNGVFGDVHRNYCHSKEGLIYYAPLCYGPVLSGK